tara:strand:+ start:413 stop:1360 length:948 start_codon:yes stop_codon:yes gene_type:complete
MNDSYGNKRSLDDWTQVTYNFDYLSIPGLAKECFLDDDYSMWHDHHHISYFWGNHIPKKGSNIRSFGVAPFVYGEQLSESKDISLSVNEESEFSTVFLSRSDFSTNLREETKTNVYENLMSMNLDNPLFITYPVDYEFWKTIIPKDQLYCISRDIFNVNWTQKLIKLYKRSKEVYFPHVCSGVLYCSYMGKNIKFYDEGLIYEKVTDHTYSPFHKSKEWNHVMNYLKDVFSDNVLSEEKKFFTYNLLSLNVVQTPIELYKSLYFLCYNEHVKHIDEEVERKLNLNLEETKFVLQKCDQFKTSDPPKKSIDIYTVL